MLLEVDGLCDRWEEGVPCFYDINDNDDMNELPYSIRKLVNPSTNRSNDISGMGNGNDVDSEVEDDNSSGDDEDYNTPITQDEDGYIKLQDLSLHQFRKRLIVHFNIAFKQNKVKWPAQKRNVNILFVSTKNVPYKLFAIPTSPTVKQ